MIDAIIQLSSTIVTQVVQNTELLAKFLPVVLVIELPLILLVIAGIFSWYWQNRTVVNTYTPNVSFVITCYGEGDAINITIDTLVEQIYPGNIEILVVVDGAVQNQETYEAAIRAQDKYRNRIDRVVRVIPKWQRGGRVSTLNSGLYKAKHDIVINVDGDTSFDNDMVTKMMRQFVDPNVIASGGALRVRNWNKNLLTRMQSLEYMMSMQGGKTGTSQFGFLNNISGAFGAFRKQQLKRVGGWDTHTAEDLDLTMRLKQYKRRYPESKLAFTPHAVGHTDAPDTLKNFVLQRLRWDGDLLFLYLRKHIKGLTPKLLGWRVFLYTLVYGVLQNVLLPIFITLFTVYIFASYPILFSLSVTMITYAIYVTLVLIKFTVYLTLISERKQQDIGMVGWLALYPLYALFSRFITAFSILNETFRRSHEESSMAPWWVLKRGRRF
ncbi:glycosyltransferase family 2 protein [Vibrio hangzhouensis]|uniref:glycosyltransferase family 2 protein n=1 Tax=Vibrio hangzhouensis TaxID=462991 RepID=UPI001C98833B|nr:glycosyltransferase [Vibrio hangzhouensis]MBY6198144.1 glycosyltransferase [Vibrio hangzhouensis]